MRFKPTSVVVLRRETKTSKWWSMVIGNKRRLIYGLYKALIKFYRDISDQDRITKIRIEVFREK